MHVGAFAASETISINFTATWTVGKLGACTGQISRLSPRFVILLLINFQRLEQLAFCISNRERLSGASLTQISPSHLFFLNSLVSYDASHTYDCSGFLPHNLGVDPTITVFFLL